MKIFKTTDEKFEEIGFIKVKENEFGACYEKIISEYGYVHVIDIMHKHSGNHIINSYEKGVNKSGLNNAVGLNQYETKLALKKMKELRFV
jgi:hypothetical protein